MERGRSWDRNQDRKPGGAGWGGMEGPAGDARFPERFPPGRDQGRFPGGPDRDSEAEDRQTSWQQQPGINRDRPMGPTDSPAGGLDDIPFKKPKVRLWLDVT